MRLFQSTHLHFSGSLYRCLRYRADASTSNTFVLHFSHVNCILLISRQSSSSFSITIKTAAPDTYLRAVWRTVAPFTHTQREREHLWKYFFLFSAVPYFLHVHSLSLCLVYPYTMTFFRLFSHAFHWIRVTIQRDVLWFWQMMLPSIDSLLPAFSYTFIAFFVSLSLFLTQRERERRGRAQLVSGFIVHRITRDQRMKERKRGRETLQWYTVTGIHFINYLCLFVLSLTLPCTPIWGLMQFMRCHLARARDKSALCVHYSRSLCLSVFNCHRRDESDSIKA